ncbi:uncharacterized protein LOC125850930 [Solanum stenotomum]|uniref:uncharacterized protein LOC125850930 n=1 Tax=Solanum stenotomum TaxID=172797 RepID=UPI0020D083CF|nr:uncharacterized protein LOC125850930 [Solanum stenotomum]
MTNPTASDPIGPGHNMVPNDSPETSEDRTTIQHDEHIARLTQEIEDLRSELTRVRDLTNLSITLQSPLHEPRSTAPNPPRFPSLDSPVPEHFPPQQPPPTNNNLPSTTPTNPSNFPPVYTPPQSQPPTYNTYATPPNPPLVNPQNQPPTHTPHVSLPTNTYPLPTTNHVNPSNTPPPIQNTPIVQTYTTQHIQGAHIATPYVQHVPPVYAMETQAFTNPIPVKFQPEVDQYEEMEKDVKAKADDVLAREIRDLKEAMRNLQTTRGNKSLEYEDLCVQPDIDLPVGYKLPKFDTFNGIGDPHTHLRAYCDKLVGVGRDERVRMKLFIRSLSGEALAWYTQQDLHKWRGWSDMAQDFMDRFQFNTDIIPDRFYLTKLKKKSTETFREYALRWRSEAARVQPPMSESEMTATFIESQDNSFYYEKMITMMGQKFTEIIRMGEILEEGIKSGRIQDFTALHAASKAIQYGSINGNKKKKEDVSAVMIDQGRLPGQALYHHPSTPYHVYNTQANYYQPRAPTYNKPHSYQPLQASPFQNRPYTAPRARPNHDIKTTRNYTKIAEPLAQLFERLKTAGMIQPIEGKIPDPIPKWFDGSKRCAYHSGVAGHDTEDCYGLKNKIEALIKEGAIQLTGPQPNVNNNPLPKHGNADVNMITIEENVVLNGSILPIRKVENDTLSAFDALIMTTHEQTLIEVTAATTYMSIYNSETPAIWGAEPDETLTNWTCTPSLVRRGSW